MNFSTQFWAAVGVVALGLWGCQGHARGASADPAVDTIVSQMESFEGCARDHKRSEPDVHGKALFRIVINSDGSVASIQSEPEELRGTPFVQCASGVIKGIKFASHEGTARTVNFPMKF